MLRLIAVAAASIRVAAWQHHRTLSRRATQHSAAQSSRKLQTRRQADLYGGQDTQRNEDIEALKRAFYGGGTEDSFRDAAASDARLVATANEFGLIKDVPLCRWSMHLLPHQQSIPVWIINQCVGCTAMTRPSWLGRAVRNRHRHAIEQALRRWRGVHD